MKYKLFLVLLISFIIFPQFALAQDNNNQGEVFEARVVEILEQKELIREDGSKNLQQDIKLKGLSGNWKNKEIVYKGISEIDVVSSNVYKEGNKVLVHYSKDIEGNETFYITDYIRSTSLYFLAFIFGLVIILVGKKKGLKALISLIISFIIIITFIIPKILAGSNPLVISVIGSFVILALIIYFTEGLNKKSNLAVLSVFFTLIITLLLSLIFTSLAKLTGLANEDAMFLIGQTATAIDFKGLLLAGILIGTLGVLDC